MLYVSSLKEKWLLLNFYSEVCQNSHFAGFMKKSRLHGGIVKERKSGSASDSPEQHILCEECIFFSEDFKI